MTLPFIITALDGISEDGKKEDRKKGREGEMAIRNKENYAHVNK